jgi:hypothetical protein
VFVLLISRVLQFVVFLRNVLELVAEQVVVPVVDSDLRLKLTDILLL